MRARPFLISGAGLARCIWSCCWRGRRRATGVDASHTNIAAARTLADEMGVADRVEERQGDFVELQEEIPAADIVTLDRAI